MLRIAALVPFVLAGSVAYSQSTKCEVTTEVTTVVTVETVETTESTCVEPGLPVGPLVDQAALEQAGFKQYWLANVPIPEGECVRSAYLIDENIYLFSCGGVAYAVETATGLIRWANALTEPAFQIHRPAQFRTRDNKPMVAIVTGSKLNVLDRYTGDTMMTLDLPSPEGSAAIGGAGRVYVGGADGKFYAFAYNSKYRQLIKMWDVNADGPVTSTPLIDEAGRLVFASQGGHVFSCSPVDKALYWSFRAGGAIKAELAADIDAIYVPSADRSLYKLSASSGALDWRVRFPWELENAPAVASRTVYQYCLRQGLSAISADSGLERWRVPEGRTFVAHAGERDFVFTGDRRLLVLDHANGDRIASINASGTSLALTNQDDDAVYLVGSCGEIFCARSENVPYLRRQQILAAQRQLNVAPGTQGTAESTVRPPAATQPDDPYRSRWDRGK